MESQSSRGFAADMVSEIKCHIHKISTKTSAACGQPYVGVIHRLDKPVSGLMVYAKTKQAAAILSRNVCNGGLKKQYLAILCGKPVDNVGKYVDYLLKSNGENYSEMINRDNTMWITNAKRAELDYRVIHTRQWEDKVLTLAEIDLLTGRHHQIRVQFAGHGLPLWGDNRYNPEFTNKGGTNIALAAWRLSFSHPLTGKKMQFEMLPDTGMFREFQDILIEYKRSTNQK